jgi:hypothetical protein
MRETADAASGQPAIPDTLDRIRHPMLLREANRATAIAGLGNDVVSLLLEERPDTLTNDLTFGLTARVR